MPPFFKTLPALLLVSLGATAQTDPLITAWKLNTTGLTGFNGLAANVQRVQYSAGSVYVSCSSIPSYTIGPWPGQPTMGPGAQNFTFRFTRTPQANTGTPTATPGGHVAVWTNGVSVYTARDANSYNNLRIWNQDAVMNEGRGFDACNGHPNMMDEYHNHVNPKCVYNDRDSSAHSPIIGFAFDGYPIYGTYAYASATAGGGAIKSMKSSYRMRSITTRTTLPGSSTVLPANQQGPAVSMQAPLGKYVEDYEYVAGRGDLDEHNGRFCKTPEYPAGTYAYFVTLNRLYEGAYPYTLGPTYYGVVPNYGNTGGPNSGHVVPAEPVTTYVITATRAAAGLPLECFPNPAANRLTVRLGAGAQPSQAWLVSPLGQRVSAPVKLAAGAAQEFDLSGLANGVYFLWLEGGGVATAERIVVAR